MGSNVGAVTKRARKAAKRQREARGKLANPPRTNSVVTGGNIPPLPITDPVGTPNTGEFRKEFTKQVCDE